MTYMQQKILRLFLVGFLLFAGSLGQRKNDLDEEQRRSFEAQGVNMDEVSDDTIFLTPPKLSEEDHAYKFMPLAYRCDGCRGVAYQLRKRFRTAEDKKSGDDPLSYVEVLDIVDELCKDEFKNYGIKNVMGRNMLSGEGLEGEHTSGMVDTGGIWEKRMQRTCEELVGEYDEEDMYGMYKENDATFIMILCDSFCGKKNIPKGEL